MIRVLFSEIGRILSHLLNVTTQAMDVGALTPPLWGFEEREKLMVFYERASGARMHAAYFRPGGVHQDLPQQLVEDIGKWIDPFLQTVANLDDLLTATASSSSATSTSASCPRRRMGLGILGRHGARLWRGLGPAQVAALRMLCRDGFRHSDRQERRLLRPYLIRMEEMRQSAKIMRQCVDLLLGKEQVGPVSNMDGKVVPPKRQAMKRSMEALIHHFKL